MSSLSILTKKVECAVENKKVESRKTLTVPPVSKGMFKLHSLMAFVGARGSGKTNSMVNLVERYWKDRSINRIFCISPTFDSNPELLNLVIAPEDVYKTNMGTLGILKDILSKIEKLAKEWDEDQEYKKIWHRWETRTYGFQDQIILEMRNYRPPQYIPKPSCLLILDDMMKTEIYSVSAQNPFNNLCTLHRHIFGVGLTIMMLVQNFKTGVPLFLRQNIQQFFIWKTNDLGNLESMWKEFGNACTFEAFVEIYSIATEKPHHFLTIDPFNPVEEERFRQNFDSYLIVPKDELGFLHQLRRKSRKRSQTIDLSEENESDSELNRSKRRRSNMEKTL
jgi:hypothetical protein